MSYRSWAKENQPAVGLVASVLAIIAVAWATIAYVFAPPVLAIDVETSTLQLPWSMYQRLDKALATDSIKLSDSARIALRDVRSFLRDTKSFAQITLTNSSSRSLSNVDVRFRYVRELDGWAIEGDAFDTDEKRKLLEAVRFDPVESMLSLKNIQRFPPKSTLKLFLWGDVSYAAVLGDEQVSVTYDGGAGSIITERTIRGLDAFIYENAGLVLLIGLLINLSFWTVRGTRATVSGNSKSPPPANSDLEAPK
jgi:hypothetical protein